MGLYLVFLKKGSYYVIKQPSPRFVDFRFFLPRGCFWYLLGGVDE